MQSGTARAARRAAARLSGVACATSGRPIDLPQYRNGPRTDFGRPWPSSGMRTPAGAWALLFVAPAMFAANILVARLAAGWLPPLALTFWRWFFTALLACALASGAVRASWPAMKREGPA